MDSNGILARANESQDNSVQRPVANVTQFYQVGDVSGAAAPQFGQAKLFSAGKYELPQYGH